jgi:hypothetical protein
MNTVKAGGLYFALVFTAGWILGPVRELLVIPLVGQTAGLLLEAPVMILVMISAARWVIQKLRIPSAMMSRLTIGLIGLGFLMIAEVAGTLCVRRLSLAEYVVTFGSVSGAISLLLFLLYVVMPLFVNREQ